MDGRDTGGALRQLSARVVPPLAVLVLWAGVLSWWTTGFSAFTTYSHALQAAGPLPRPAPSFRIRDQFGVSHDTTEFRGGYVLLQFIYLSCSGVCPLAIADFHRVQTALEQRMPDELVLLTISFDPARDTTERLLDTWTLFGRPAGWYIAALATPLDDSIQAELSRLGVWVSRRDANDFNHSARAFLLDPAGQVVAVLDTSGDGARMVAALEDWLP